MKTRTLFLAVAAVVACAALLIEPAFAAWLPTLPHGEQAGAGLQLATALIALRAEHADLVKRAADKLAEIKDGLPAEQIRAIETDHAKLVAEAEAKKREISAAEEAERKPPTAPQNRGLGWTGEEIAKVTARAVAFGLDAAAAMEILADGNVRSLDAATDALQERAVKARGTAPRQVPQHVQITADEGDKLRAAVGDAILLRANPQAIVTTDVAGRERVAAARQFRGMSLLEAGRDFMLRSRGIDLRGLSKMEVATVLLGMRQASDFGIEVRAGGMHSTSDFTNVLANVASKRLRDAYQLAPATWKQFCRQSNAPDFKTKYVTQLSSAPALAEVKEGKAITYGQMGDAKETYALVTYGRIIAITRQTIVNDDLGAFDRLPSMFGASAAALEASTIYGILTGNPTMSDSVALFHGTHGNLLTGSVIDETNLALARKAMRVQQSFADRAADKQNLNLFAKYLVTGAAYEIAALKMLSSVQATATSGVNPFQGTMIPVVDANISGNKWFTIADPSTIDTIEYAYLEGEEGLRTEQRMGFEVEGLEVKAALDFVGKAIDWRGMTYNPGA